MKKRRVEIMIETHQTWIVRQPSFPTHAWCMRCAGTVRMVTTDEAARLTRQSTRAIYSLIEAEQLHYCEMSDRSLLICCDSLRAAEAAREAPTDILAAPELEVSCAGDCAPET